MARRISWQEPDLTTVTQIEISRSTDKNASYSVLDTINATSDGLVKSTSNTWVTTYTDTTGTFTHWYIIRFQDSVTSLWSDYSAPITTGQEIKLCTVEDVKKVIDTVGKFTDDKIFDEILETEEDIYADAGVPISAAYSTINSIDSTIQDTYYVGEEDVYRVDRAFYGTATKHELFQDDSFKTNLKYGMIRILPVASGGPVLSTQSTIEVRFVPRMYHRLAVYMTAKHLLESVDYATSGKMSKQAQIIENRLATIGSMINNRIGMRLSSDYAYYDPIYGVNKKKVIQDHDRNRYLSSYGWT